MKTLKSISQKSKTAKFFVTLPAFFIFLGCTGSEFKFGANTIGDALGSGNSTNAGASSGVASSSGGSSGSGSGSSPVAGGSSGSTSSGGSPVTGGSGNSGNNPVTGVSGGSGSAPIAGGSSSGGTSSGAPVTTVGGGTCAITSIQVPVNVLFVVDRSGSNSEESQDEGTLVCTDPTEATCAPPTDPNLTFRGGSISTFFNQNQSNLNFSWGFLAFQGTGAQSYILNGPNASFGTASQMQKAIALFYSGIDTDATPYLAALNASYTAIGNDPGLNLPVGKAPLYEIIFLSDGYPTDALNPDGSVDLNSIDSAITRISRLAPGRVFLSAVYYGTINDPNAASTLQNMASVGGGQFVNADTGSTSSISINNLITVPTGVCN